MKVGYDIEIITQIAAQPMSNHGSGSQ